MFYVYILKSQADGSLYVGETNDLRRRFKEHNSGQSRYTETKIPFVLIYYEAYKSEKDAWTREIKLKRFKDSYTELKKRLVNSFHDA